MSQSLYGSQLLSAARTLRQGVFSRLITHVSFADDQAEIEFGTWAGWKLQPLVIPWLKPVLAPTFELPDFLKIIEETKYGLFVQIPFSQRVMTNRDHELIEPLQDLACIISIEATAAFKETYYPGVPDVDALSDEHIAVVMVAMQREIDREGSSRAKTVPYFDQLSPDRQKALAERRRYWYQMFGITPLSWPSGFFSLWDVSDMLYPEIIGGKPA